VIKFPVREAFQQKKREFSMGRALSILEALRQ